MNKIQIALYNKTNAGPQARPVITKTLSLGDYKDFNIVNNTYQSILDEAAKSNLNLKYYQIIATEIAVSGNI